MLKMVFDEMVVTEIGLVHLFGFLLVLGKERASTPSCSASQKFNHEPWLAMTDISEEKEPLYISIYASRADVLGVSRIFF